MVVFNKADMQGPNLHLLRQSSKSGSIEMSHEALESTKSKTTTKEPADVEGIIHTLSMGDPQVQIWLENVENLA